MLAILQWNARSPISNGYEFKGFIERMHVKPDVICIQETWLKGVLDFVLKGYTSLRRDRQGGNGGGCAIFVKEGLQIRELKRGDEWEFIAIEIWSKEGSIKVINFYNPGKQLEGEHL